MYELHGVPQVEAVSDLTGRAALLSEPVFLNTRVQVLPPDPYIDWKGPEDLSVVGRAGWTPEGIVLLLEVTDDIHTAAPSGSELLWKFDSVQVGFDMSNRAAYGYNEACFEYTVALSEEGPVVKQEVGSTVSTGDASAEISREGATTTYRLFFPWEALSGEALERGDVFRMNFVVNDNDGKKRECWIGLTPGIGGGKQPGIFPQWMLR